MSEFSHLDLRGNAQMVGVAEKPDVFRRAVAEGAIALKRGTVEKLQRQALPKGDVLTVAKIAGIQAAKQTSTLIPLCHPLPLHRIDVHFEVTGNGIHIRAEVETISKTGVEMEALTAVCVAALAIYDMCKAVDDTMQIGPVRLLEKQKSELPISAPSDLSLLVPPVLQPVPIPPSIQVPAPESGLPPIVMLETPIASPVGESLSSPPPIPQVVPGLATTTEPARIQPPPIPSDSPVWAPPQAPPPIPLPPSAS
jgi:cyclic pyranopterin phosphate synthase